MAIASKTRLYLSMTAGAVALALAGGGGWLWSERMPIASSYIDAALKAKNVPAHYRLARIGFRTHRIEAIRIGDPNNPDLTADWAEIELGFGLSGVRVRALDAAGVRLKGRLVEGKLSLGAIDRLLPESKSDQPFALPELGLTARAIKLDLETPYGMIRGQLDGEGGLDDGFVGAFNAGADHLVAGDCGITGSRAALSIRIEGGRPRLTGPVQAAGLRCATATLSQPKIILAVRGSSELTAWRGKASLSSGALAASGASADRFGGAIDFDTSAKRIEANGAVMLDRVRHADWSLDRARVAGRYSFGLADREGSLEGEAHIHGARMASTAIADLRRQMAVADGTPMGPVLAAWGAAIGGAASRTDGSGRFRLSHAPLGGAVRVERIDMKAAGGGLFTLRGEGGEGVGWRWPGGGAILNGKAELGGGGFPAVRASFRQAKAGGAITGDLRMEPYRAAGARLQLATVTMRALGERTLVSTTIDMDGPLADGRIEGLRLPVALEFAKGGAIRLNSGCTDLGFERAWIAGARVGRARLPLCPVGGAMFGRRADGSIHGGASLANPRLRGSLGGDPLSIAARSLVVELGRPGFRLDTLAVRLGSPDSLTLLDASELLGAVDSRGLSGSFSNLSGKIGAVPLLLSEMSGDWRLASSVLTLGGSAKVEDSDRLAPRLKPLAARDIRLRLAGGKVDVDATLREPRSELAVASVAVAHDLSSGVGNARIDVDQLRFGRSLQPEAITPLTLGMIANVDGAMSGQGRISWADGKVSSNGRFTTEGMNLAAAFGPVTGLKGTINFTDLIGLTTAPDQRVMIDEINPGVSVTNGVIRYRLLPEQKLEVTEGLWPFAGGTLRLEPTLLDMGQPVARKLTFRIDGLDAASFVQQLDFKNISVTGKFDGVLPIIFDAQGGRIENGFLKVRPGGGTLSYVGDVTNADLGRIARIAFDALKSMRYDRLTIDLNGSLDGEIVSQVRFDGTNSDPVETARRGGMVGRLLSPVTRLPFRFKITIAAPFRGLVNSAQSFVDPAILLRNTAAGAVPTQPPLIQPR